jgi:serine protease Do
MSMWIHRRATTCGLAILTVFLQDDCGRRAGGLAHATAAAQPTSAAVTPMTPVPEAARVLSDAFARAAAAIRTSVVRVDVELDGATMAADGRAQTPPDVPDLLRHFFQFGGDVPVPRAVRGTGSGFIIDSSGHVVTNAHVVDRPTKVTITLADGRKLPGKVVGRDSMTDVAVVQMEHPPSNLRLARLGDAEKLRIGEWVIAVGSPLGMDQTVTAGIVSGLGKTGPGFRFTSGQRVRRYIQTDAEINPGNSGGPLVNLQGEVVGINTLINVGPGGSYGFAIPINQARDVASTLIKEGRMRYAYLGVEVGDVQDAPAEVRRQLGEHPPAQGAVVTSVTPGSPAAGGGLRPADVITRMAGRPITGADDVVAAVGAEKIGARVPMTVVRDGRRQEVQVTLAETPGEAPAEPEQARVGLRLQTLTPTLARALGLDESLKGVVISEVVRGSPADRAGLQPGEVIREIDRKAVTSAGEAVATLRAAKGTVLLRVTSAQGTRFVSVSLGVG